VREIYNKLILSKFLRIHQIFSIQKRNGKKFSEKIFSVKNNFLSEKIWFLNKKRGSLPFFFFKKVCFSKKEKNSFL
jgi:hypothetical protein